MSYRDVDGARISDGILSVHVYDILGCGMSGDNPDGVRGSFEDKMGDLSKKWKLRRWRSQPPLHFSGVEVRFEDNTSNASVVQEIS